ncbi:MAG: hypothetical protein CO095_09505 [Armatimonadetes bacterium CG_4_9_14_3_um_filter_58_7]|nr:MAG: hypothetical protein CO095_09505 [Armatimonadetes bacterium CG_4_9_14_3_um_filter_58_7]
MLDRSRSFGKAVLASPQRSLGCPFAYGRARTHRRLQSYAHLPTLCFILLSCFLAFAATVDDLYKQAAEKETARDYAGAIAVYQRVADDYPEDARSARALVRVGDLLLLLKKPDEAVKAYQYVSGTYHNIPEVGQALLGVAKVYRDQNNGEQLEQTLLAMLQQLPQDLACDEAVQILQNYYIGDGHPEKVTELIEKLKAARPPVRQDALLKLQMEFAKYLFAQGKVEEGNKLLAEVEGKAAGPHLPAQVCILAIQGLIQGKQFDAAEAKIKEGAKKFEDQKSNWDGIVGQYPTLAGKVEESGDPKRALAMTDYVIATYPTARELHWMYVVQTRIYEKQGQMDKALEACNQLLEKCPGSANAPETCARLAKVCADRGDAANAIKLYTALIERYPDHRLFADAALYLGDYYFGTEKYDQAITYYDALLKRMAAHPKAATAQYRIGLSYERLGKAAEAKAAYEKTVKNFGDRPEAAAAKRKLGQ